jgi:DNA polymerase-3 subunit alpha
MAFVKLEDTSGVLEVVVFPKIYAKTLDYWQSDKLLTISGKVDEKDDRLTLLVDDAKPIQTRNR